MILRSNGLKSEVQPLILNTQMHSADHIPYRVYSFSEECSGKLASKSLAQVVYIQGDSVTLLYKTGNRQVITKLMHTVLRHTHIDSRQELSDLCKILTSSIF